MGVEPPRGSRCLLAGNGRLGVPNLNCVRDDPFVRGQNERRPRYRQKQADGLQDVENLLGVAAIEVVDQHYDVCARPTTSSRNSSWKSEPPGPSTRRVVVLVLVTEKAVHLVKG